MRNQTPSVSVRSLKASSASSDGQDSSRSSFQGLRQRKLFPPHLMGLCLGPSACPAETPPSFLCPEPV